MKLITSLVVASAMALAMPAFSKDLVKMSTLGPGSSPNLVMTTFATIVNQNSDGDIEIQVNATGAAPKHAVEAATQKTDMFMYAPVIQNFMMQKKAMFAKVDKAPDMAANLRGILAFPIGVYHFTTIEGSGIESFDDIKGKKVFTGPPVGAARVTAEGVIKAMTGFVAGEDYEAVKLGWGAASQAFQDGQIDLYVNPTNAPSPVIQQVALSKKIRILGIPDARMDDDDIVSLYKRPGGAKGVIPAGIYGDNQLNETDVNTIKAIVGIGAGVHMSDETVYNMTKLFWENIDTESEGTPWLRALALENAFEQMNLPLHAGALKYYDEIGLDIPAELRAAN